MSALLTPIPMQPTRFTREAALLRVGAKPEPPLFTAEFVQKQDPAEVARVLDACFYDLIRAENKGKL